MKNFAKKEKLSFPELINRFAQIFLYLFSVIRNTNEILNIWTLILSRINKKEKDITIENVKMEIKNLSTHPLWREKIKGY
ncbi:MAG: hypothetical protein V3V33_10165 [Candidatus Lokiarchaeia archaeon]